MPSIRLQGLEELLPRLQQVVGQVVGQLGNVFIEKTYTFRFLQEEATIDKVGAGGHSQESER
jgi:hypothetical protein